MARKKKRDTKKQQDKNSLEQNLLDSTNQKKDQKHDDSNKIDKKGQTDNAHIDPYVLPPHVGGDENYSIIAGILAGLIIVLGGGLLWSNQQTIITMLDGSEQQEQVQERVSQEDEQGLYIGKEVALSGVIIADNLYTYISTPEYGVVGIENADSLEEDIQGRALIGGSISSYVNNTYFVTVNTLRSLSDESELTQLTESTEASDVSKQTDQALQEQLLTVDPETSYIPQAGLRITQIQSNNIRVQPNINQQYINIRSNDSNSKLTINYFVCQPGHEQYDCLDELQDLRRDNNLQKAFTLSNGDVIYRIVKTNQWFGNVDERFGYYISSNSEAFVDDIVPSLEFASEEFIQKNIVPSLLDVCNVEPENFALQEVVETNTLFFDNVLSVDVLLLDTMEQEVQCIAVIDLTNDLGARAVSIDYVNPDAVRPPSVLQEQSTNQESISDTQENESMQTQENQEDETDQDENQDQQSNNSDNPDNLDLSDTQENVPYQEQSMGGSSLPVEQVAIDPSDPLEFTFNAGYTVAFPSQAISFQTDVINDDLGKEETNCTRQINVVAYEDRDREDIQEAVRIYVCSTSLGAIEFQPYRYIASNQEGRAFIVQTVDPAWSDFVSALKIED